MVITSIVVLNWKGEAPTQRSIGSVQRLEGIEDCEIILVDNESTEPSRQVLSGLGDVGLVALNRNLGSAGGMNAAIDVALEEHIALFNNDLLVHPSRLNEGLRVLQAPPIGIVGGASLSWDGEGLPDPDSEAKARTGVNPERGFAVLGGATATDRVTSAVDGRNILARAHLLRALDGFDLYYFAYYEDIDLCARAWASGYETGFNPAMKVWYRRGGSSDRVPRERAFWAATKSSRWPSTHTTLGAARCSASTSTTCRLPSSATQGVSGQAWRPGATAPSVSERSERLAGQRCTHTYFIANATR